jgi:hypothetical protein
LLWRSHVSSPEDCVADKMTISYSPTAKRASMRTPSGALGPMLMAATDCDNTSALVALARIGAQTKQGSCSQYSTRRGAVSASIFANTS